MSEQTAQRYRQLCPHCIDFHTHFLNSEVLERSGVRLPLKSGVRSLTFKRQFVAAPPTSVVRIASG